MSWYEAAEYCNWLSSQEGIPKTHWCYEPNAQGEFADGMKMKPNYLALGGYRIPTEAEWEYACRGGCLLSRYFGETEDLLGKYGWYTKNSLDRSFLPVGSLKPNDFGLFDMLGNATEWCQERQGGYAPGEPGKPSSDIEDEEISDRDHRIRRGGSFINLPDSLRSAGRGWNAATNSNHDCGFRPVRTITVE